MTTEPDNTTKQALAGYLLALADDELVLAHRNSEWTGHGPILEEDIAFTNIALDEMGHAQIWYEMRQALTGETPDALVFFREAAAYRNVQLVELPKGDWAFSMLRQYLFDAAENVRLRHLQQSTYPPLAHAAAKIGREEVYHLRHTGQWVKRLGLGTPESNGRLQMALDELWPYAQQLWAPLPDEGVLAAVGIAPDAAVLRAEWEGLVRPWLETAELLIPGHHEPPTASREAHTAHLTALLADMQQVARLEPEAEW